MNSYAADLELAAAADAAGAAEARKASDATAAADTAAREATTSKILQKMSWREIRCCALAKAAADPETRRRPRSPWVAAADPNVVEMAPERSFDGRKRVSRNRARAEAAIVDTRRRAEGDTAAEPEAANWRSSDAVDAAAAAAEAIQQRDVDSFVVAALAAKRVSAAEAAVDVVEPGAVGIETS